MAILQCARNDARKKKRLAEQNLATNITESSSVIVSRLVPAPRVNPSPASVFSSSLSNFEDEAMSPVVEIPSRVAVPQNRSSFRPVVAKAVDKPSSRKPFRYGFSVYFDQMIQETFGPYGSAYGLSDKYVTKLPVYLDVLQELCDLRSTLDRTSDISCINRWIRLLAESIDLPASRFEISSFFDELDNQQSSSSSSKVRFFVGDSYKKEEATYGDSSSLFLCEDDGEDVDDVNRYHEDPPADFGPMVEEE